MSVVKSGAAAGASYAAAAARAPAPTPASGAGDDAAKKAAAFLREQEADAAGNFKRIRENVSTDVVTVSEDDVDAALEARLNQARASKAKVEEQPK